MPTRKADTIIVGAGLGGLATAALLARSGQRVRVLERSAAPGGLARTRVKHGFSFNRGARALYFGGAAEDTLRSLGVPLAGNNPSITGYVHDRGRLHRLPASTASMLSTSLLTWRGRWALGKTLMRIRSIDPSPFGKISAQTWVDDNVADEATRRLLASLFRLSTYVADLRLLSADAALTQLRGAMVHGVVYLDGGWQSLVDGLRSACVQAGVTLETGAHVTRVGTGVVQCKDGSEREAHNIVLAVPPAVVSTLTGSPSGTHTEATAACLDLALDRLPQPKGALFGLDLDQRLYFSVHSQWAELGPRPGALIHMLAYHDGASDGPATQAKLEAFAEQLQPGWRDHVVANQFFPQITVSHSIPTPQRGGLRGRPSPLDTGHARVFAVGDWVGPTGMLADAVFASARQVAAELGAAAVHCGAA